MALAVGAMLFLVGCEPKEDAVQSQANITTVIPESPPLVAVKTDVEREAEASDQQPTAADEGADVRYTCDDKRIVLARYGDEDVQLSIDGKRVRLPSALAASGAKYMRKDGISPGKSLAWWSKGDEAMLIEAPSGAPPDSDAETIVNCRSKSPA